MCFSGGFTFNVRQIQELLALSASACIDGGALPHSPSVENVIEAMETCNHLPVQKLVLYNSSMDTPHAARLSHVLRHPDSCITVLVLSNIPLRIGSVVSLSAALCHGQSKLEQLVLESCSIGSIGASAIIHALRYNKRLWKLDLSKNHITDSICEMLVHVLLENESLRVRKIAPISHLMLY